MSSLPRRELAGLILASALITLDGTATTVSLPAIGRDLSMPVTRLQWISNAPLLMLAAALLPAGALADRLGRLRSTRIGLGLLAAASMGCVAAPSGEWLIGSRALQGLGGALILPAVLASLRAAFSDPVERTRTFGVWAAWTGVASAAGPLVGGALVDLVSWRAVFAMSAAGTVAALVLLSKSSSPPTTAPARGGTVPVAATAALAALLGTAAYVLIEGPETRWTVSRVLLAASVGVAALATLLRSARLRVLLPRELTHAHNCIPANAATFALYFGMFGMSFVLVLYTQQVLGYSGLRAGAALLPVSIMLFGAELLGRLTQRLGSRAVVVLGAAVAAAGLAWLATGPHPLAFWSRMIVGTALFGLGVSLAVSPITHAAVSAVPEGCAGAASGLNHATVRGAGLIAIALLGSIAAPGRSQDVTVEGFRRSLLVCAAIVGLVGGAGGALVRDDKPGGLSKAA